MAARARQRLKQLQAKEQAARINNAKLKMNA